MKRIKKIVILTIPKNTGNTVEPSIEIMDGKDYSMIYTDNPYYKSTEEFLKPNGNYIKPSYKANKNNTNIMVIPIETNVELSGDIFFKIVNS